MKPRQHYQFRGGIEPIEFIVSNGLSFLEGNIVKYVYRYPLAGIESLYKARAYLDKLIESEEAKLEERAD